MIEKLIPLTKNKMEILKVIYEKRETHLLEIAKELRLHPYSAQKTLAKLKPILAEKKAGRTNLFSINKTQANYSDLVCLIEDYRLRTKNKSVSSIISHLANLFSDRNVLVCCLFGSYARVSFTKESDIDVLLVVRKRGAEIKSKISQLSSVLNKETSPLLLSEKEFNEALMRKEPSIMSLKQPKQRLIIKGADYFLEKMPGT